MELYILSILFISVNCVDVDENKVCSSQSIVNLETNNTVTDIKQVCDNSNHCVMKCCDINSFYYLNKTSMKFRCEHIDDLKRLLNVSQIGSNIFDVPIYKLDASNKAVPSEKSISKFTVFQNKNLLNDDCKMLYMDSYLFENGQLGIYKKNSYVKWKMIPLPKYCVDTAFFKKKNNNEIGHKNVKWLLVNSDVNKDQNVVFTAVAMVISAFFMVLVLVVYSVLKQLRNIQGMVLMAYVATLLFGYLFKAILLFGVMNGSILWQQCKYLTPICYGFLLSSFFWLKIMSFDIWWTFRATRKIRSIHRQGELMKFMWYGLYAWGTPAAIAIFSYCVDNADVEFIKPNFELCLSAREETILYLFLPILIVTIINTLLFLMTIYNIWLINRAMNGFEQQNAGTNKNRFCLYIKVSLLMGVSWIFELIQNINENTPGWLYIVLNIYNVFIGVAIFFMFVFKRSIFLKLCKKFNINHKFVRSFNVTSTSRNTENSVSGKSKSKNTMETVDLDDLKSDVEKTVVSDTK